MKNDRSTVLDMNDITQNETRDIILDVTEKLIYRHGIAATGMDLLVKTAGVSRKSIYRYFANKDELVVAALQRRDERWMQWLRSEVERSDEVRPELRQQIIKKALAYGLYAPNMPEHLGGGGLDAVSLTLMERELGNTGDAKAALDALVSIQLENGLFPAATVQNLSTGFDLFTGEPWVYSTDAHIAPTAWFILALNNFNPYRFD